MPPSDYSTLSNITRLNVEHAHFNELQSKITHITYEFKSTFKLIFKFESLDASMRELCVVKLATVVNLLQVKVR